MRRFAIKAVWLLALTVVVVFGVTFATENYQSIEITYFGWRWDGPIAVALGVVLLSGFFLGIFPGMIGAFLSRRALRRSIGQSRVSPRS
ncbi:MAG: LapA family protein [Gammaproteobacteria bacterium]